MTDDRSRIFAGVDLGGNKIAVVLACASGEVLAEAVIPTLVNEGPEQAVKRTSKLLEELAREARIAYQAIGIGLPGLVDRESGRIVFLPNLPEMWQGFPIAKEFELQSNKPVSLLNDARLATLGEFTFGNRAGGRNMLFVTVGTGIGGGLVLDGKLYLGAFGAAGEIGHHTILPDGPPCSCGSRGCLETLVSGPALAAAGRVLMRQGMAPMLEKLVLGDEEKVSATIMARAAERGDRSVGEAIRTAGKYLGIGIANAVTICAVDHVVIGGGLSALGDLILEPVREAVRQRVRMFPSNEVHIRCTALGAKSGALGGVALAAQEHPRAASTLSYGITRQA